MSNNGPLLPIIDQGNLQMFKSYYYYIINVSLVRIQVRLQSAGPYYKQFPFKNTFVEYMCYDLSGFLGIAPDNQPTCCEHNKSSALVSGLLCNDGQFKNW